MPLFCQLHTAVGNLSVFTHSTRLSMLARENGDVEFNYTTNFKTFYRYLFRYPFFFVVEMAEEDVRCLFEQPWTGIVQTCLSPLLNSEQVREGLILMNVAPEGETTSFLHRFRQAVYDKFHQLATGKATVVNVTGKVSLQLTYNFDVSVITNDAGRQDIRDIFATNLMKASYEYRRKREAAKDKRANELVMDALCLQH